MIENDTIFHAVVELRTRTSELSERNEAFEGALEATLEYAR